MKPRNLGRQVDALPAPGQRYASLEVPREHKGLIEPNAIVRYLSKVGKKPWAASSEEVLRDNALIEFEETALASLVKSPEEALTQVESVIAKYSFADSTVSYLRQLIDKFAHYGIV